MITCLALSASLDVTYLVDSFEVGAIHRPSRVLKLPGGKALNVARAIAVLGAPVGAIAVFGGHTGELMAELLADSGVALRVVRDVAETRSCVTIADEAGLTEIYEPSAPLGPGVLDAVVGELARLEDTSWLVLAGSVPDGTDLAVLGRAILGCRERGIRIAIDTHGAALTALLESVQPDLVKVNRFEAAALLGEPTDAPLERLAEGLRARTGRLVVVTDGAHGAIAVDGESVVSVGPPVRGLYSVGSGDCFLAGFLVALDSGATLSGALALATATAAANAATPGAALFQTP